MRASNSSIPLEWPCQVLAQFCVSKSKGELTRTVHQNRVVSFEDSADLIRDIFFLPQTKQWPSNKMRLPRSNLPNLL